MATLVVGQVEFSPSESTLKYVYFKGTKNFRYDSFSFFFNSARSKIIFYNYVSQYWPKYISSILFIRKKVKKKRWTWLVCLVLPKPYKARNLIGLLSCFDFINNLWNTLFKKTHFYFKLLFSNAHLQIIFSVQNNFFVWEVSIKKK